MTSPLDELVHSIASHSVDKWQKRHGAEVLRAQWDSTERGDLLLTIANYVADRKALTRAACACARQVLSLIPADELPPRQAIDVTERWLDGQASLEEVAAAASAANASSQRLFQVDPMLAAVTACDAAAYAAATALGVRYQLAGELVPHLTADNVGAAIRVATSRDAMATITADSSGDVDINDPALLARIDAAKRTVLGRCADLVRQHVPPPDLAALIQSTTKRTRKRAGQIAKKPQRTSAKSAKKPKPKPKPRSAKPTKKPGPRPKKSKPSSRR